MIARRNKERKHTKSPKVEAEEIIAQKQEEADQLDQVIAEKEA